MTLLCLFTGFLVEKEIQNALARFGRHAIIKLRLPQFPTGNALDQLVEILESRKPDLVLTINANGLDRDGKAVKVLNRIGSVLANWHVDNPLYQEIYGYREVPSGPGVFNFVSDRSYVGPMQAKGRDCRFLPLGFDPTVFHPMPEKKIEQKYDVVFVGNSTLEKMAELVQANEEAMLSRFSALIAQCRQLYARDQTLNIPDWLNTEANKKQWRDQVKDHEKFEFLVEWFVGFQHRKDFVVHMDRQTEFSFRCFGDADWNQILTFDPGRMSVGYYTNLCETYHTARINLNVTRSQIRDGFTQRIFDCLGAGCFLLTDARPCNNEFFTTYGPDIELVEFTDRQDALSKIRYFLDHPQEREAIAQRGYRKVLENHTYLHRIQEMLRVIEGSGRGI